MTVSFDYVLLMMGCPRRTQKVSNMQEGGGCARDDSRKGIPVIAECCVYEKVSQRCGSAFLRPDRTTKFDIHRSLSQVSISHCVVSRLHDGLTMIPVQLRFFIISHSRCCNSRAWRRVGRHGLAPIANAWWWWWAAAEMMRRNTPIGRGKRTP